MEREFYIIKDENGKERKYAINSQEEKDDFFNNAKTNNKKVFDQSGNAIDFNNIPQPGKSQGANQPQNNQQENTESSSENTSSESQLNNTNSKIEKSKSNSGLDLLANAFTLTGDKVPEFLKEEIKKDNIRVEEAEAKLENTPEALVNKKSPRKGSRKNQDGTESTHLMMRAFHEGQHVAFPSLFQDDDGNWIDYSKEDGYGKAYEEAKKRNEIYTFDTEEEAINFADKGSWKTKPIKNETELAERLTNQYTKYDFQFAEANYLGQTVKMISPDGKHSIKIHLNDKNRDKKVRDFFKKHYDPNAENITPTKEDLKNQVEKTRKESEKKTKTDIDNLALNFNPEQQKTDRENLLNEIKNKTITRYDRTAEGDDKFNEVSILPGITSHVEEYRKHKVTQYNELHKYKEFYDPNFDTSISDDDILMSPDFMKFVKQKHGAQGSLVAKRMGLDEIEKYNNNRKTQKDNEAVRLVSKEQFRKFLSEKNPPEKFDEQLWNRGLQGEGGYFKNPEYLKIENENKKRISEYLSKYNQIQQNPNYSEEERLTLQNELKDEYDLLANSLHNNILQENKVENITKQETEENRNLTKATKKYLEEQNLKLGTELAEEGAELLSERNIIESNFDPIQKDLVNINNELKSTQPALNKLNKKYNINFKEDEEGNKIYNLDYINEGIEKINKKYKDLPKTEEELKALLNKKVDEVKAKYDLTDEKQVEKANKEITEYQQSIQDQLNTANNEINTYRENELNKIRQYEKEKDLIISKHNNNLELYKEKYNDYLAFEKKYNEINSKLDDFQDTKLVLDLSLAENRKRLTAFGDGEWWNIKSKEVLGNFAQNFMETAGAIYDIGDRFTDNLVDMFIKDKDSAQFLKTVKAHMIPLGHYFDEDSMGAVTDKKTGLKISMYDEDKFNFDKSMALANEKIKQPLSWEDLKANGDGADWAEYFISHGVGQVPVLLTIASTGGYALPLLGANSAGGKYKELSKQKNVYERSGGLYGQDLSYGQMLFNAGVTGLFEGGSEYVTAKIFGRTLKALAATPKPIVQQGFINHIASFFTKKGLKRTLKGGIGLGTEWFAEGASEVLAQAGSNMADMYINGDKTVGVLDGWDESFVNGAALASFLQSPRIFSSAIAPFRSDNKTLLGNIARELNDVTTKISDLKNFGPMYRDLSKKEREKQIEKFENEHTQLVVQAAEITNTDIKRIDLLNSNEKKTLLNINKSNLQDQDLINKTLNDKRLNDSTRDQRIKAIEKRINNRNKRKQNILDKYPPEVVNKNYRNQVQTMQQMADMVAKMGGPTLSIQELTNEKYQQAIKEIESKKQDMSESEIEARTSELEALYDDYTNIIDNSKNKKDVEAAKKKRAEITNELGVGINILKSNSAGVMSPIIEDGKITGMNILINKDAVVDNGMFNTGAHEFIHATFANTLKGDPAMRQILGSQLQDIIDGKGVTFKPGKKQIFEKKISQYRQNQQGEEMLAVLAEMIIGGDVSINNSFAEKATGVFRRFSQNVLGHDIKFDEPQSLKKFLTDFSYSFKNNKPSKAIARMIAEGANGKIFKDARTPDEIANREMESYSKIDQDLIDKFDMHTRNADGSKKYKDNKDFNRRGEDDRVAIWTKIMDSGKNSLDNQILRRTINADGSTKFDPKGLPAPVQRDYIRKVKEILQDRFLKNFNVEKNESAAGYLFGKNGILYFAKLDVSEQYVKEEGGTDKRSLDRQTSEGQSYADIIEAKKDNLINRIDNITLSDFKKDNLKQEVDNLLMVTDLINLPTRNISSIKNTIKDADVLSLNDITDPKAKFSAIKNIKNLIIGKELDPKVINPRTGKPLKSEKATIPTGPYFGVLNSVAAHMGIDPLRVLANQDLNNNGRKKAQDFLYDLIVNENGDLNPQFLEIFKGAAATVGGKATGLVGKTFVNLFNKKGRAKKSDTGAGLEVLELRNDITKEELLDMFGMDPNGSKRSGTKADGTIREFSKVLSTLAATQEISINAIENNLASEATVARLKDGRSNALYSNVLDMNTEQRSEVDELSRRLMGYAIATPNGMMTVTGAIDKLKGRINKIKKDKTRFPASLRKELADIIQEFANADPRFLYVLGTGMTFGKSRSIFGVVQAFKDLSPELKEALEDVTKAFVYKEIGKSKRKGKLNNITKDPKTGELKFKLGKQSLTLDQFRQYELEKFDLLAKLYDTGAKLGSDKAYFLKSFHGNSSSQMAGLQRSSAFMTALPINTNGTLDNETFIEQEHMFPQNLVGSMLFISSYKSPKEYNAAMKIIEKSYGQMPLRKGPKGNTFKENGNLNDHNGMVAEAGYAKSMPEFFEKYIVPRILDNSLDYLPNGLAAIVRYTKSGINLNGYQLLDGQTITEYFGVNVKNFNELSPAKQKQVVQAQNTAIEQILSGVNETIGETITKEQAIANVQAIAKSDVIGDVNPNEFNTRDAKYNAALKSQSDTMLSKLPPKVQGLSVFDFDDTLGITKSGVQVKMPNLDGKPKPKRKVIFLAGGAGSGKSNVVKKLNLEKDGFKIVNSDISLEWLKKNSGLPADMRDLTKEQRSKLGKLGAESRKIARRKMMKYRGDGNGVVVDGTGGSMKSMTNLVNEFKDKGYDVSMLYVDTSLETALERNRARKERSLLDTIVKRNHESVKNNKQGFKEMFGDTFMEVNTDNLTLDSVMPSGLVSQMNDFVSGYEKRRIDATEFAEQGDQLLREGAEFDFSEFNKVVEGRPGPLLGKALERAKRFGTKDIFVLTARPAESAPAIQQFLKSQGLEIPLQNITGLANSTGAAKAEWMLDKFAEGYNDMYFADDAMQNVTAVKEVLDQLDIKSDVVQAKLDQANRLVDNSDSMQSKIIEPSQNIDMDFNEMLERKKGMDAKKRISGAEARVRGRDIGRFDFYIPPSAEDFKGLLYYFLGKGKRGDADMKFFSDKLLKPFAKGIRAWNTYKQQMADEFRALKKSMPKITKSLNDLVPGTNFTNDSAVRVYLWNQAGITIPNISKSLEKQLVDHVNNNPDLKTFADNVSKISRIKEGYTQPGQNWVIGSIARDLSETVNKVGRKQFLSEWINNKDVIFNSDNMNKIEALYGTRYREALENILYRMENGGNRVMSNDRDTNFMVNWINGAVGSIMFFNMRSAILQTISAVNFVNFSDNNIFKATAAFANQPQFWKDFVMLFNSDQLKQRRRGLQTDVSASELVKSFKENGNTYGAVVNYLLEKGFTPTQIADSVAIAFGGASFYRNRFKKYKKQGMTDAQANEQAMLDFQEIAEETQQSSREDLVSKQQASILGRIVLAFQNVTMQYGRLTKKALSDLTNRRGDTKTNISKILYYGAVQNIVFASLQSALAFMMFGEDEEQIEEKKVRVANNVLDSFLRGTGIYGALASTLKNTAIQWHIQSQKAKEGFKRDDVMRIAQEALNLSPPIGSKVRKIVQAYKMKEFGRTATRDKLKYRLENPKLAAAASLIEGITNIPLARLLNKANNLEEAITGDHETWKRVAMALGWSRWELGLKDEEVEAAREEVKEEKKEEKRIKQEEKKKEKEKEKEEQKKKEEEEKKKKGIKTLRCSGIRSNGTRCKITGETSKKKFLCVHHAEFKDGMDRDGDGKKEYRCTATTSSGKRCKNKTENKNKKCYAHQ